MAIISHGGRSLNIDQRLKKHITGEKTKPFLDLFLRLSEHYGGQVKAKKALKLSNRVVNELQHGKISFDKARQILNAYNKINN